MLNKYSSKANSSKDKIKINYVNSNSEILSFDYSKSIFESKRNLIKEVHGVFCDIENCILDEDNLKENCFSKILLNSFDNSNYKTHSCADFYVKLTYGLLNELQLRDIDLFIPLELIERFHYMEIYTKYKFYKKKYFLHNLFENEKFDDGCTALDGETNEMKDGLTNNFFEEIIKYHELKDNKKMEKYDNIIYLFTPNMAFQTPLHILLENSKFSELIKIKTKFKDELNSLKKKFDGYSKDNSKITNEIKIIFSTFKVFESFKTLTEYEFENYTDLNRLINVLKRKELSQTIEYFQEILNDIIKAFKNTVYSYYSENDVEVDLEED